MVDARPVGSKRIEVEFGDRWRYNSIGNDHLGATAMDWPYHFPHPADVMAREAERFRRLSPEERVRVIAELAEVGRRQLEVSPNRAAIEAQIEADERAWQQAHRQVFHQHGHSSNV